jgi:hypothetical protein
MGFGETCLIEEETVVFAEFLGLFLCRFLCLGFVKASGCG